MPESTDSLLKERPLPNPSVAPRPKPMSKPLTEPVWFGREGRPLTWTSAWSAVNDLLLGAGPCGRPRPTLQFCVVGMDLCYRGVSMVGSLLRGLGVRLVWEFLMEMMDWIVGMGNFGMGYKIFTPVSTIESLHAIALLHSPTLRPLR